MPGNMEYNLDKTLNVSGWRKEIITSLCKPSTHGKRQRVSDAAVYRHEVAHAPFYIADKDITTADTAIMVMTARPTPHFVITGIWTVAPSSLPKLQEAS